MGLGLPQNKSLPLCVSSVCPIGAASLENPNPGGMVTRDQMMWGRESPCEVADNKDVLQSRRAGPDAARAGHR